MHCGLGECRVKVEACIQGKLQPCIPNKPPRQNELCDHKDNNCDGKTDEGFNIGKECTALGECGLGKIECEIQGGITTVCSTAPGATQSKAEKEICDQKDNNCDGETDEKLTGCGLCGVKEVCGDGKDNDCNGSVDEGCQCKPGEEIKCGDLQLSGIGECQAGLQKCNSEGKWQDCQGEKKPIIEKCDLKDNDCDGLTDEEIQDAGDSCGQKEGLCQMGKIACAKGKLVCQDTVEPVEEECGDKLDNNCDGKTDEDCDDSTVKKNLDKKGGVVNGPKGSRVILPEGAVSEGTEIKISPATSQKTGDKFVAMGDFFHITSNSPLAKPATVILPYDQEKIPAGHSAQELVIFSAPDNILVWGELPSLSDKNSGLVAGVASHFSYFVVGLPKVKRDDKVDTEAVGCSIIGSNSNNWKSGTGNNNSVNYNRNEPKTTGQWGTILLLLAAVIWMLILRLRRKWI